MTKFLFGLIVSLLLPLGFVFASVAQLEFVTPEQVISPDEMSGTIIIQTQDSSGEAVAVGQTADVTLESSSETGEFFNDSGEEEEFDPTMAMNWKSRKFRYRDSTEGEHEITVTVTIRTTGESWSASQDITVGDEPEEDQDEEEEEINDDQDEDKEVADNEEENEELDEKEEIKKEEKKVVTPKPVMKKEEAKPEEISPELLMKLKMALTPQVAPVVFTPPIAQVEPEPEPEPKVAKKTEKVEEKAELIVTADSQVAVVVAATSTPEPVTLGPIVIEKKLSWWQRFWQWLFGN